MSTARLVEVNLDNLKHVIELCVTPEQERFVGTTAEAIAEAYFHPEFEFHAIEAHEPNGSLPNVVVGFLMFTIGGEHAWLQRFLVDCKHQGRGYGSGAWDALIVALRDRGVKTLSLSVHRDASEAIEFYTRKRVIIAEHEVPVIDHLRGTFALAPSVQ